MLMIALVYRSDVNNVRKKRHEIIISKTTIILMGRQLAITGQRHF